MTCCCGCFVVVALLFVTTTSLPLVTESPDSAESLLSQLRVATTHGSSPTTQALKDTLKTDLEQIRALDNNDAASLPDEIALWTRKLDEAQGALNATLDEHQKLTESATTMRRQCDEKRQELSTTKSTLQTLTIEVKQEDELVEKEKGKFDASAAAVQRDIDILEKIQDKLVSTATDAAESSGVDPKPIQHQVHTLINSLKSDLEKTLSSLRVDWELTKNRLDVQSNPVRQHHKQVGQRTEELSSDVEVCQHEVEKVTGDLKALETKIEKQRAEVAEVDRSLKGIQPAFAARHRARIQRMDFLESALHQLDSLH